VTFELVDSAGTVVPAADTLVRFTVTPGAALLLDNGDLTDHTPHSADRRRTFNGRGLAILRAAQPGRYTLTATADGLPPASVSVQVRQGAAPAVVPAAR
jgi:beta-galactosidase